MIKDVISFGAGIGSSALAGMAAYNTVERYTQGESNVFKIIGYVLGAIGAGGIGFVVQKKVTEEIEEELSGF